VYVHTCIHKVRKRLLRNVITLYVVLKLIEIDIF
jgi:hypothetical protein